MKYVWDASTKKMVHKTQASRTLGATIDFMFEPFVSPIDGKPVRDRRQLAQHNKRHGVTDPRDYGRDWFKRKTAQREREIVGNTPQAKVERIELIKHALEQQERKNRR